MVITTLQPMWCKYNLSQSQFLHTAVPTQRQYKVFGTFTITDITMIILLHYEKEDAYSGNDYAS